MILQAEPSAVSGYDQTKPDLLDLQSGNYQFLRDDAGLITRYAYYTATTATTSTPGGVKGYHKSVSIQRGELGTPVTQSETTYIAATAGATTIYLPAGSTVYRNSDGTGAQTTTTSYTFVSGTVQVASQTVTLPAVSAMQNGPGTASSVTAVFDAYNRPIWTKDQDGFLTFTAYDPANGSVLKTIIDVDTTQTSDFANLPSGWSTPSGGGLHLISTYENDSQGRVVKATDPVGNITYTVYNDANHEVRVYPGWNASTNTPTGPTQVMREDRPGSYTEMLTMSAAPNVAGGRPDGTEAIAGIQSLSRSYTNSAGQVVSTDVYFHLAGLTYSTSTTLGTEGTHFLHTRTGYDHQGRVNRMQEPNGTIRRMVYDGQGRMVSEWIGSNDMPVSGFWSPSNPAGMSVVREYQYDNGGVGDGNLTRTTEHPGGSAPDRVAVVAYDWRNRVVVQKSGVEASESTSLNRPLTYREYDNLNQVVAQEIYDGDAVTITDANNDGVPDKLSSSLLRSRTLTSFDDEGKAYQVERVGIDQTTGAASGGSLTSETTYNRRGQVVLSTNPANESTTFVYDGAGRMTASIDPLNHRSTTVFDAASRVVETINALGERTTFLYDAANRQIATIDPLGHRTTTSYDLAGRIGSITNANNATTTFTYDAAGRQVAVNDALNQRTTSLYSSVGQLATRVDALGGLTSFVYDNRNRQIATIDPLGHRTTAVYNNLDETVASIDPLNHATTITHDVVGRQSSVEDALNRITTTTHDALGGVLATISPLGQRTTMVYDPFHRVAASQDAMGAFTTFTYDAADRRTSLTDPVGNTTTFVHDASGREVERIDPLGNSATFAYDAVNRLSSSTDRLGRRRDFAFDAAGRNTGETWIAADGVTVEDRITFTYDAVGNQLTARNQSGTHTLTYDALNRVVTSAQPTTASLTFTYDALNRRTSVQDNFGGVETSTYDAASRLTSREMSLPITGGPDVELRVDYTYDAANRLTSQERFSDLTATTLVARTTYAYDVVNQLTRLWSQDASNATLSDYQYTFDTVGRLTQKLEDGVPTTYSYDATNQLTAEDFASGTDGAYSYDSNGNRTMSGYATGNDNQLTADGTWNYTYDLEGNRTGKDEIAGTMKWEYRYDHRNQLVRVDRKSNGTDIDLTVEYKYDSWGNRIEKSVDSDGPGILNPEVTLFALDGWNPMRPTPISQENVDVFADLAIDGSLKTRYFRNDRVDDLSARIDDPTGSPGTYWHLSDHQGSIRTILDSTGTIANAIEYDAYGNIVSETNANVRGRYAYTGREIEAEIDLQYNRARYYDPAIGRWVSKDPLDVSAGDSNLYRYASNSPTYREDPSGLQAPLFGSIFGFNRCLDFLENVRDITGLNKIDSWHVSLSVSKSMLFGPQVRETWYPANATQLHEKLRQIEKEMWHLDNLTIAGHGGGDSIQVGHATNKEFLSAPSNGAEGVKRAATGIHLTTSDGKLIEIGPLLRKIATGGTVISLNGCMTDGTAQDMEAYLRRGGSGAKVGGIMGLGCRVPFTGETIGFRAWRFRCETPP